MSLVWSKSGHTPAWRYMQEHAARERECLDQAKRELEAAGVHITPARLLLRAQEIKAERAKHDDR